MSMAAEQITKTAPSREQIALALASSTIAGPWDEPDHHYVAACGCEYAIRAYNRGEGWAFVCPSHRGDIRYIDSPDVRGVLPYGCSSEEYLEYLAGDQSPAFIAFLEGRKWRPATYEYGSNAGEFSSPLESRGAELWYHRVRQGERTKSVLIATKVD